VVVLNSAVGNEKIGISGEDVLMCAFDRYSFNFGTGVPLITKDKEIITLP